MERSIEKIPGSKFKITFTLSDEEKSKYERKAVQVLSEQVTVSGFRPGKAPDNLVRAKIGADSIERELLWQAFREQYTNLVREKELQVVGQPQLTPVSQQPFKFAVEVVKLPEVTIGNISKIRVEKKVVEVAPKDIDDLLKELQESRVSEAAVNRPAQKGDRVEMDFEVSVDKVIIDGGASKNYPVVLGAGVLVPGFEDNLVGVSPGEEKVFDMVFPPDYRKDLAGKKAQVKARVLQVFERTLPELKDEFAVSLGQFSSLAELREKLETNVREERQRREDQRLERAILEEVVKQSKFEELPEILIKGELDQMIHELSHGITEQGLEWNQYLQSIKKDEATLRQEFVPKAEERVKIALVTRALAKQEHLLPEESTIDEEVEKNIEYYGRDEHMAERLRSEDYKDHVRYSLTNRRVIEWLKKQVVQ